jgi:MFS family permease
MSARQGSIGFEVGGARARRVLVICSLLQAVCCADWQIMAVVLQPMKIDLGLSDAQVGLVNTAYFLGTILFTIPVSCIVDAWSRTRMLGLMAITWSAFTLFTGAAGGLVSLMVVRMGVGIGEAGFSPAGTALVSASFPEDQRARRLGMMNACIPLGTILGVTLGGYLSTRHGWRTPLSVFSIPGIVLGILAFFLQDYSLGHEAVDGAAEVRRPGFLANLRELLGIRSLRWLYLGLGMNAAMQVSVGTWLPALLMRAYDIQEDAAGLAMGTVTLLGLAGPVVGGVLADRWMRTHPGGRMRLAAGAAGVASVCLWLALMAGLDLHSKPLMYGCAAAMVLHSAFIGMAFPAAAATVQDVVPARLKGQAWGTGIVALFLLGGAWGPLLVGSISEHFGGGYRGPALGLAMTGLFGWLASGIWWVTARHVGRDTAIARRQAAGSAAQ